jgi:hypothetical protein
MTSNHTYCCFDQAEERDDSLPQRVHARGQQTAEDWIVMHGGGRRRARNNMPRAYRRNRRAARFPSIHVCGAELINSACMYLHGALLERRAVRVACCLTTMFLREQHTALLCCGLRRRRRRRREPKARRVHSILPDVGAGAGAASRRFRA